MYEISPWTQIIHNTCGLPIEFCQCEEKGIVQVDDNLFLVDINATTQRDIPNDRKNTKRNE